MNGKFTYCSVNKPVNYPVVLNYEISDDTYKRWNGFWKVIPRWFVYFMPWIKNVVYASRSCPDIKKIVTDIKTITKGWPETNVINFIVEFGRSPKYSTDSSRGLIDYWATAQETLYIGTADCEDYAILINTLLLECEYDCIFIWMRDHMACAVSGDFDGTSFEKNGKKYYYVETVENLEIGKVPSWNEKKVKITINSK